MIFGLEDTRSMGFEYVVFKFDIVLLLSPPNNVDELAFLLPRFLRTPRLIVILSCIDVDGTDSFAA